MCYNRDECRKSASDMGEFIAMIYMKDVSKVYDNGTVALDHVNVRIEKGDFVFLVGEKAGSIGASRWQRLCSVHHSKRDEEPRGATHTYDAKMEKEFTKLDEGHGEADGAFKA